MTIKRRTKRRAHVAEQRFESADCAICGRRAHGKSLHLDHNHQSHKTRGYLCAQCNTGLGMFKDSPQLLRLAIKYLEWWEILHREDNAA